MPKKKFRVGVAARTVDGREIKPEYIKKMGALYDPIVYGARINLEHLRGIIPDSAFKSYGDVISVEVKEEVIGGEKRFALYAEIDPTEDLVELSKKRQKIYTSMEIQPNFPNEGDFYLVGLAITDSPASMGTQQLSFSASAQNKENLYAEYFESEMDFIESESEESNGASILERIKEIFSGLKKVSENKNGELESAIELLAKEFTALAETIPTDQAVTVSELKSQISELNEKFSAIEAEHKELSAAMEDSEKFTGRPPAVGGDVGELTDC